MSAVVCRYALGKVKALTCYKTGCRSKACSRASAAWSWERKKSNLHGMVPAEAATARIEALKASGMTVAQIAQSSGLAVSTVRRLVGLRPDRVPAATARAVARVKPATHPHVSVDATGTRRRIQALQAMGWPIEAIAAEAGLSAANHLCRVGNGHFPHVFVGTRDAIAAAYDRMWDRRPPPTGSSAAAITRARKRGYVPPLAWDDDEIDDPKAKPRNSGGRNGKVIVDEVAVERLKRGQTVPVNKVEQRTAIAQLAAARVPSAEIADRLGMGLSSAIRTRNRITAAGRKTA